MPDNSPNPMAGNPRSFNEGEPRNVASAEDGRLLNRVRERDQAAMATIFDRYARMAYSVAFRVLNDSGQAEDVMQDVFFQLWQNPESFAAGRGSLGAWIAVVVRNRAIDLVRKRRPTDPVEEVVLPAGVDVAADVEQHTMVQRIRTVLKGLPAEQRATVEMAFFDGLTHSEIAAQTGDPLGTVKTRIRAALMSVRRAIQA